uniref:2-(3-amino-3-carboxypropyl)histidine synthase subunit 1 n=1 Tax=Kalanchoe fedtschenkoi TaxID=63787 RepID=A0A7N0T6Z6_KALFE
MEAGGQNNEMVTHPSPKPAPKRIIRNQVPDSILNDASLNTAISLLPSNYNFEVLKCVWRIKTAKAKRVALQFPEGLLMYALHLSDIFQSFAEVNDCLVLGDVTYGACCVDDFSAVALGADLLIHYGHSCLVPIDSTTIPCLYVFVDIMIDVDRLVQTVQLNFPQEKDIILAGTIQFGSAIREAKPELERAGYKVLIPQAKPLSAGEVLGCTAPSVMKGLPSSSIIVFVADGRFHLEAFMIANPGVKTFRYDPYIGKLFLEEYDHKGMKASRMNAILKARKAKNWGIVLGTLGRQGNPRILDRLETHMTEKGCSWTVVLLSEISPAKINLFGGSIDAWIQIACPRLSIDWGDAFTKPLLTPYEAEICLGHTPGWWERPQSVTSNSSCKSGLSCGENDSCCGSGKCESNSTDYPMDYYAEDGGEWNSSYVKKATRPRRKPPSRSDNISEAAA